MRRPTGTIDARTGKRWPTHFSQGLTGLLAMGHRAARYKKLPLPELEISSRARRLPAKLHNPRSFGLVEVLRWRTRNLSVCHSFFENTSPRVRSLRGTLPL